MRQSRRPTTLARPLTPAAWRPPLGALATWQPGRPKAACPSCSPARAPATSATGAPRCWSAAPPLPEPADAPACPSVMASGAWACCSACACTLAECDLMTSATSCCDAHIARCTACASAWFPAASAFASCSALIRPASDSASRLDSRTVSPPRDSTLAAKSCCTVALCAAACAATSDAALARCRSASAAISHSCIWSASASICSRIAEPPAPPPGSRTTIL